MKYYIGIDLGTTNSAISVYNGETTRVYKSRQNQASVTPSCIYIDRNGKQMIGVKAYNELGRKNCNNVARQFKRFMGTSTTVEVSGNTMSPVQCSAEILRELMRCLPEEIVNSDDKATVITVPAAFNQMQNAATEEAAKVAKIGKVSLMQEPVAAIMRSIKKDEKNGNFLVFDIGGGTLDIAIASVNNGKIDVVAHGGVAMCGGADIDKIIVDEIVVPWLEDKYDLPDDFACNKKYEKMLKIARYQAEQAKKDLSSAESADIYGDLYAEDENGEDISLDITLTREEYEPLCDSVYDEAIEAARNTISKSGLKVENINRIVFIGGPTHHKYLRDKVSKALGIAVDESEERPDPMTAVSEGAAIYAETIDWSSVSHTRKASIGEAVTSDDLGLSFKYDARVTDGRARIGVRLKKKIEDYKFQIKSVDSGWDSGMVDLKSGQRIEVPLMKRGVNIFEVEVFDDSQRKVTLKENRIEIFYASATVNAILASHSIGIEVKESAFSDATTLDYIVREGDKLPVKGTKSVKATETVKANSSSAIVIKMWEGEISSPVTDNRLIGAMKIEGSDLEYGSIKSGTEIILEYTVNEAGSVDVTATIPSLDDISFSSGKNFYARDDAQLDMSSEDTIYSVADEGEDVLDRVKKIRENINDDRLDRILDLAQDAAELRNSSEVDPEIVKKKSDNVLQAKILLDQVRKENLVSMRKQELEEERKNYTDTVEKVAKDVEKQEINEMFKSADRVIDREDSMFESLVTAIRGKCFITLFSNSDSFVVSVFKAYRNRLYMFSSKQEVMRLVAEGEKAIESENFDKLRNVVANMVGYLRGSAQNSGIGDIANIMRG